MRLVDRLRATVARAAAAAETGRTLRAFRLVRSTDRLGHEIARALQAARQRLQVSPGFAELLAGRLTSASRALDALRGGPAL
jgi:hypothetical protein